jgi:Fe-S-cluster-containing hydrogenase component 2
MDGIPRVWGKTRSDIESLLGDPDFCDQLSSFPESCQNWSQLETRTCRRWLLELSLPGTLPRRGESAGVRRTLAYLGRGESVGEMGVVLDLPRNATCVAYDHPDSGFHQRIPDSRTGGVPSRVELVKIPQDALRALMKSSPLVKSSIDATIRQRQEGTRQQTQRFAIDPASQRQRTPRFDELGLVQGQQLMLIDLDRCTRCGACVDACVAAHDDGNTRLYLDGPRYENYLVPLTCRKCLDPVCMIGCPVGAINRGNSGEIQVRDWCIGCRLCADQCPYGSIQMNHLSVPVEPDEQQWRLLGPDVEVKAVISRAVVCDMCSSLPGGPSCVYSCPHEAAIRVDSKGFFFDSVEISGGTGSLESVS